MSSVRDKARRSLAVVGLAVTGVAGVFGFLILLLDAELEPIHAESSSLFQSIELSRDVRAAYVSVAEQMIADEPLSLEAFAEIPPRIETLERTLPLADRQLAQHLADQWRSFESTLGDDSHSIESEAEALSHAADRIAAAELGRALVRQREAAELNTLIASFGTMALIAIVLITGLMVRSLSTRIVAPLVRLSREVDDWTRGETHASSFGSDRDLEEVAAVFDATHGLRAELLRQEQEVVAGARLAAIGQLAAGVAHEMNNPIGVIRGYIHTMTPAPGEESEVLARLSEQLDECAEVVSELLSVTSPGVVRHSLAGEVRRVVPDAKVDEHIVVTDLDRWIIGFRMLIRCLDGADVRSGDEAIIVDGSIRASADAALWLELAREFITNRVVQTRSGYRIELRARSLSKFARLRSSTAAERE